MGESRSPSRYQAVDENGLNPPAMDVRIFRRMLLMMGPLSLQGHKSIQFRKTKTAHRQVEAELLRKEGFEALERAAASAAPLGGCDFYQQMARGGKGGGLHATPPMCVCVCVVGIPARIDHRRDAGDAHSLTRFRDKWRTQEILHPSRALLGGRSFGR